MYYFSDFLHSFIRLDHRLSDIATLGNSLNIAQKFEEDHYILIFYSLAKGAPTF